MSELRELLTTAAPPPPPLDVDDLRGRVRRRRRRRRVAAATSAVVVALLSVSVGLSLGDGRDGGQRVDVVDRPPTVPGAATYWDVPGARSVAIGAEGVWVVGFEPEAEGGPWFVVELDPVTGQERRRVATPGVVHAVAVGDGVVWAFGGGDGAEPDGGVVAIDEGTGEVLATHGWDAPFNPYAMALTGGDAWVSSALSDEVLRLRIASEGLEIDRVAVGDQPTDLLVTADGNLWVRESLDGTVARVDQERLEVAERQPLPSGRLFGPALHRPDAVWAGEGGGNRVVALRLGLRGGGTADAVGTALELEHPIQAVAADTDGIWVATQAGISRYDVDGRAVPGSTLDDDVEVASMVTDGTTVWFVTGDRRVGRWSP